MKRLHTLTLKQLRALRAVTEQRSISGAGEQLGLTPPAVHSQLKILEDHLGAAVIYREGIHAFQPTPVGAVLLSAFRRADSAFQAAFDQIDALLEGRAGQVVLAAVSTGKYFAPRLVARLRKDRPDIAVNLRVGNRDWIISALNDGTIDLAIMGRPPRQPEVTATDLGPHPHVLIAPPDHPLARHAEVPPQAVLGETIILREPGSGTRLLTQRFLDRLGEGQSYQQIEMDSNETIKQAVMAGLGIAIISAHTVTDELQAGRLVALRRPDLPIMRRWYLMHRSDSPPEGAALTVWQDVLSYRGAFLPNYTQRPAGSPAQ
ncbi:LysR family transcriptional regulator [uncultured Paracoccus sp.]|uniref:LysR family transcriptional regulator n=1 Tax=uncultured Paracoccus sp. TaxID=189685 RepID=UPI002613C4D6|nr:LysR family transcriptional regulator [uncultured Paracoccus sp.]